MDPVTAIAGINAGVAITGQILNLIDRITDTFSDEASDPASRIKASLEVISEIKQLVESLLEMFPHNEELVKIYGTISQIELYTKEFEQSGLTEKVAETILALFSRVSDFHSDMEDLRSEDLAEKIAKARLSGQMGGLIRRNSSTIFGLILLAVVSLGLASCGGLGKPFSVDPEEAKAWGFDGSQELVVYTFPEGITDGGTVYVVETDDGRVSAVAPQPPKNETTLE